MSRGPDRPDQLSFTLAYGDCDTVGIIYFARYFPWMERCSTLWWHSQGVRVGHLLEDHGIVTVAVNTSLDYIAPARVLDEVTVRMVVDRVGTTSFTLGFDFTRAGELLARGSMTFACRDQSWVKIALPDALRAPLAGLPTREAVSGAAH